MFTEHLSCTGTELGPGDTRRLTNRSSDALCGLSCLRVEKQSAVDIWGGEGAGQRGQSTPGHGVLPCDIGDEHLQMRRLLFPETLWPWGSKRGLSLWLSGCGQWGGPRVQQSGGGHGRHARRPAGGH